MCDTLEGQIGDEHFIFIDVSLPITLSDMKFIKAVKNISFKSNCFASSLIPSSLMHPSLRESDVLTNQIK